MKNLTCVFAALMLMVSMASAQICDGTYALRNKKSGLFVTVHNHSATPEKLIQWNNEFSDTPEGHQEWTFKRLPNGYYSIQNRKSGLFLTVDNHSTAAGAKLIQWHNEFGPVPDGHQEWEVIRKSAKHYAIRNKKSGLYITVNNHSTTPDDLIQWNDEFSGKDGHQEWIFEVM